MIAKWSVMMSRLKRRKEENYKGAWEFPGGKIEANESHQEALKRELKEELGISCEIGPHFHSVLFKYEKSKQLNLHCYIINSFSDNKFIVLIEHPRLLIEIKDIKLISIIE